MVGLWIFWTNRSGKLFTDPTGFVFVLGLRLPWYPIRVQRILLAKTYYADVTSVKDVTKLKTVTGPMTYAQIRSLEEAYMHVTVRSDRGEMDTFFYKEKNIRKDGGYYHPGERVLVLGGFRFSVKCPLRENEPVLCPRCGSFLKAGATRCGSCRTSIQ